MKEQREQMVVIGKGDILRMGEMRGIEQKNRQQKKQERELREMSDRRVAGWNNTIEGVRKKREEQKYEKFRREEERRRELDRVEKEIQMKEREREIGRANQIIYEREDRVRTIKSAMLIGEVMMERDMQKGVEMRKQKEKQQEEEYYMMIEKEEREKQEQKEIVKREK